MTTLPGWDAELPSKQYSGLVRATRSTFHYWLVESEGDPASDPLVIWMNGGPGASSMFGMLSELGPFMLTEESALVEPPALFRNPTGWQTAANVLAIEQPPPTGFSFCGDPAGGLDACGDWTDESAAEENYRFVLNWLERFPEYAERALYITGESYAGVYVPLLADNLVRGRRAGENAVDQLVAPRPFLRS